MGSRVHARLARERGERIEAALISRRFHWLARTVTSAFRDHSAFPIESAATFDFIPGLDWSDHASFWREGYPAIMLTDTAFLRNPHYHQPTDTSDTLDYQRMALAVEGLEGVLNALADRRTRLGHRTSPWPKLSTDALRSSLGGGSIHHALISRLLMGAS